MSLESVELSDNVAQSRTSACAMGPSEQKEIRDMKIPDRVAAHFFELETSLHKKAVRNSPDAVARLLADEFVEFGSSGRVWDKSSIVESMRNETDDRQVAVEDFKMCELSPDVVLLTYKTATSLRSSIWKRLQGRWQMIFHQGTKT